MTHSDDDAQAPSSRYENILRNTLMQRTGKNFQRNLDAAPVPQQEKEDHDQVANRIFDNILKRRQLPLESSAAPAPAELQAPDMNKAYSDVLDDLLWPSEPLGVGGDAIPPQQTLAENNPLAPANPYQDILRRTLSQRSDSFKRARGNLRVEASEPADSTASLADPYSAALDEVLDFGETASPFDENTEPSLTRTLYHQKLDEILWPSQEDIPGQIPAHPPVDEAKIRSVAARFLQELLLPEPYGLIATQRQLLDEQYTRFWVREVSLRLGQSLRELETAFSVWVFLNNLDLLRQILDRDFIEQHRLVIELMLPQKKQGRLFTRTIDNEESSSVFERMNSSKFEDVRRILRQHHQPLSEEERFHFFHFLRAKLPDFLTQHRHTLMKVLKHRHADAADNPFVGQFLSTLFFSEAFAQHFQQLHEQEDRYKQAFQTFLRERTDTLASEEDQLTPLALVAMDLLHEKAPLFTGEERQILTQALEVLDHMLKYASDPVLDKEPLRKQLEVLVGDRVQSQYQVEGQALEALGQEIGALGRQGDSASRIRVNHLHAIYERHVQAMNDVYHKRRDTLDKLNQDPSSPAAAGRSRKQFIQRKLRSCQQYLQRAPRRAAKPLQFQYREYAPEFLDQKRQALLDEYNWDNEYEKKLAERVFQKAYLVLKAVNQSKSTVKLNLKLLFGDEPQAEIFAVAMQELLAQLTQLDVQVPAEVKTYLHEHLDRYRDGLRFPREAEPTGMRNHERIGYAAAYLGQVAHLKLLLNLQYQQVIFDFKGLFELLHSLYMLDQALYQPHLNLETLFRQTLMTAWNGVLSYCLLGGGGQHHFVANPLALNDYSWHPPLELGLWDDAPAAVFDPATEEFQLLSMDDVGDEPPLGLAAGGALGARSLPAAPGGLRARLAPPEQASPSGRVGERSGDELPPAPGQRRLPLSPGKFELYSAPAGGRRLPPPTAQALPPEDDDFYKILSQTQAGPPPRTPEPETAPPEIPPSFARPRSLSAEPVAEPEARPASRRLGLAGPPSEVPAPPRPETRERKRWLEITPVPEDKQNYNQMLDAILDNWDEPPATGASIDRSGPPAGHPPQAPKAPENQPFTRPPLRRRFDFDD
ncbi:MAG: hypothetical protein ACO1RX_09760 [Candidatus Sericytochromatia bacterium]